MSQPYRSPSSGSPTNRLIPSRVRARFGLAQPPASDTERRVQLAVWRARLTFGCGVVSLLALACLYAAFSAKTTVSDVRSLIHYSQTVADPVAIAASPNDVVITVGRGGQVSGTHFDGRRRFQLDLHRRLSDVGVDGFVAYVCTADGVLVSFDVRHPARRVVRRVLKPGAPMRIAIGKAGVWLVEKGGRRVRRVSPGSLRVRERIRAHGRVSAITLSGHTVWVTLVNRSAVETLHRSRGVWQHRLIAGYRDPKQMAFGAGRVWVGSARPALLWPLDAASGRPYPVTSLLGSHRTGGIAASNGSVWAADPSADRVLQIGAASGRRVREPIAFGSSPVDVAAVDGVGLFVADAGSSQMARMTFADLSAVRRASRDDLAPVRWGVGRATWLSFAVVWVLVALTLGVVVARLRRSLGCADPGLPLGMIPVVLSPEAVHALAGQEPEEWEREFARQREFDLGVDAPHGAPIHAGARFGRAEGYKARYAGVAVADRAMELMRTTAARGALEHDLVLAPLEHLPHRRRGHDPTPGELARAMRERHELWANRMVLIQRETWVLHRQGDDFVAWLPAVWTAGEASRPLALPDRAKVRMRFTASQVVGDLATVFGNRRDFRYDVLALVVPPTEASPLELTMLAIYQPHNDRVVRPFRGRRRRRRRRGGGRARGARRRAV